MALRNTQHDAIMRMYEERQLQSEDRLRKHYEEVYAKIPALLEIDHSISKLSVEQARKLLDGNEDALAILKQQISKLHSEKEQLLSKNGFPADYLSHQYACPDCKDTGYINGKKCHCFKKAAVELLYTQSNLKEILEKENFDTFSLAYYSDNYVDRRTGRSSLATMKEALQTCRRFADEFGEKNENLFFYGDTGVGKTFLSNCIARELMNQTYSVVYFTAFELFDIFEKNQFEKDEEAEVMYEQIFDCDLLIIDDLGTEFTNSFTTSRFFLCLNERLLRKKSTIISTNLSLENFAERYSERAFSRITSNYKTLKLIGDDIRIKKKLMSREVH